MNQKLSEYNHVVLIDGVCNFCVMTTRILHKLEPSGLLKFASQQSDLGQELMNHYGLIPNSLDTIIYIEKEQAFERSDAILTLSKHLKQPWKFLGSIAKVVPVCIRNFFYNFIAKHRYKIFGKRDVCYLPDGELSKRFIDS